VLTCTLLVVGAPTTIIDTFNAQDLENTAMGPGFRWVNPVTLAQQAGFRWLKTNTPARAVVQADPIVRGRDNWTLVQSFGARRAAAGLPISLLGAPEYTERSHAVHELMTSLPLPDARDRAVALGVDYLWVDGDDAPDVARRLGSRPDLFPLVFRQGVVRIHAISRGPGDSGGRP
jgi:hypothetical protein